MNYSNYPRNHVTLPGRETALFDFLNAELEINGKKEKHKWCHANNSNSEDALTWSCFDVLRSQPNEKVIGALDEILEDAFEGKADFTFKDEKNVKIYIGKSYETTSLPTKEDTEVDASIETDSKLIFIEAKLYSKISLPDKRHCYDQIVRKLRVGLEVAHDTHKTYYFIFLDIAPIDKMMKFGEEKSLSAAYFRKYKSGNDELEKNLEGISYQNVEEVKTNMGWLSWACLFKTVLKASVKAA
jgi:hypothetical protein